MNRRAAAFLLVAMLAAPCVEAQPAGKMHRVGFIATISPLAEISGPDPVVGQQRAVSWHR